MTEQAEMRIAEIGDNNPPSPFDEIKEEIKGLYEEAKNWCNGEAIEDQKTADQIDKLVGLIKDAAKRAEVLRKEEVKTHDDAKKAVQEKFNALIGNTKTVTGIAVTALKTCNDLLTPWKQKIEAERIAEERRIREEAEAKARAAAEKIKETQGDLEGREAAFQDLKQAKSLEKTANKIARAPTKGMRTIRTVKITNLNTLAKWFWNRHLDDLESFMLEKVTQYDRNGERGIPGVEVIEERVAR
jgi:hypothetical protein